jgi:hypothetical protein
MAPPPFVIVYNNIIATDNKGQWGNYEFLKICLERSDDAVRQACGNAGTGGVAGAGKIGGPGDVREI